MTCISGCDDELPAVRSIPRPISAPQRSGGSGLAQRAPTNTPDAAVARTPTETPDSGTRRQAEPASLCVVDDSGDMVDGRRRDGFAPRWRVLSHLFDGDKALRCDQCCFASAFSVQGLACIEARGRSHCDPSAIRVPPLSETSPLVATFNALRTIATPGTQEVVFITNGREWRFDGHDPEQAVEMDVGEQLCDWLRGHDDGEVLVGTVTDNSGRGRPRRPNLILGLVRRGRYARDEHNQCAVRIQMVPDEYPISIAVYSRPADFREHTSPTLQRETFIEYQTNGGPVPLSAAVSLQGLVRISRTIASTSVGNSNVTLRLKFRIPSLRAADACWGLAAKVDGAAPADMACTVEEDHHLWMCSISVPAFSLWRGRRLNLQIVQRPSHQELPPTVPEGHALRRTLETFRRSCSSPVRLGLERGTGAPSIVDELTFQIE